MNPTPTSTSTSTSTSLPDRTPQRMRHALRFRALDVLAVERVTPHLVRVTLGGADLEGFHSPGFDDHAKLFFPDEATGALTLPTAGPDGPVWPEGRKPTMRDYTPRRFDAEAGTLEIDFALHVAGPATRWAEQAAPGQRLGVGGPRGSFIVPPELDWHLLVGDTTALPAIARRLEELPAGSRRLVFVHAHAEDRRTFAGAADVDVNWFDTPDALVGALRDAVLPHGDGFAWGGGEASLMARVRQVLNDKGMPREATRVSAYWKKGMSAHHEHLE